MITTHRFDVGAGPRGRAARLAVHVAGRGPLALLLHGYPLDHRMWLDALHGPLAAQRTLAAIDLRGHGASPGSGDPVHGMELLADDAAAVVRSLGRLGGDGPVDVVGLSMGGYVALALQALHPALVRSLVLCNTRAGADAPATLAARDDAIRTAVELGARAIADAMLGRLLAAGADALLAARVRTMAEQTPVETIVADLRGLKARADRTGTLSGITVPTLVLAGELDPITPVADARILADGMPGASLVVVPGAAHLVPMERPDAFAAAVGAFWSRRP